MFKKIALFAMAAMLVFAVQAGRANADIITNGNFATNDFTGWTLGGDFQDAAAWVQVNNDGLGYPGAPSATYAQFGTAGSPITVSQTLTTTLGQAYTVSFYLQNSAPSITTNNEVQVLWNTGTPALDMIGGPTTSMSSNWTEYSFNVTGTGSDKLTFSILQDSSFTNLTDVTAEATPTPVPAALLLFGPGLAGIAVIRRKFKI